MFLNKLALLRESMHHLVLWMFLRTTKVAEWLTSISTLGSEVGKTSRTQYAEKDRCTSLVTLACMDIDSLLDILLTNFHCLTRATFDPGPRHANLSWFNKKTEGEIIIGLKFGRPTLLSSEIDAKLRPMIQNMRISDAPINIHTVLGVLVGLVCSNLE